MSRAIDVNAEPGTKRPYVKPGFRTISLVSEEVMAVGCKLPTANGSLGGPGSGGSCSVPTVCVQVSGVS